MSVSSPSPPFSRFEQPSPTSESAPPEPMMAEKPEKLSPWASPPVPVPLSRLTVTGAMEAE